ncbi:MAG: hypothetical protein WD200_03020 [Candidatus Andersenbacteria bacterium]
MPQYWWRWYIYTPPYSLYKAKRADVIIALTFGIGPNGEPGRSNKQIARAAAELHQATGKPIIAQKEVYEAIRDLGTVNMDQVVYLPGPNEKVEGIHYHSADSLKHAKEVCVQHEWGTEASLVGYTDHVPRVHWAWEKLGGTVVHVETRGIECCPNSTQLWCRGMKIFQTWELGGAIPSYVAWNRI